MKIKDLLQKRAKLIAEAKALRIKEEGLPEGEAPAQEDVDRGAQILAEVGVLSASIERLQALVQVEADSAEPAGGGDGGEPGDLVEQSWQGTMGADGRITPHGYGEKQAAAAVAADRLGGKGFKLARFALGVVQAKSGIGFQRAAESIQRRFGDTAVAKALNTAGVATGGALVPQDFAGEIIELLRAETVVRQCQPVNLPMPLGNMTIPRLIGGATAGYTGELDDIASSQESFDDVQLNAKKLTALVPVSNDLIRRAPVGVEAIVRDDLIQTLARREDLAFLLGDGSGGSPVGFINQASSVSKFTISPFPATDNGTIFTAVSATLFMMRLALKQNMSRMQRPQWIMGAATEAFLLGLITQFGMYAYKEEMESGKLLNIPYKVTQQLPSNINTAIAGAAPVTNGSYLFLIDFADVILADTMNVMVDASDVASYADSAGNAVSTFTRDQTAFRIIEEHDLAMRHQASIAVAVLPGWAPAGASLNGGAAYYVQAPNGDMSAAPSTWGAAAPTGSNMPANIAAAVPGGTLPGRA